MRWITALLLGLSLVGTAVDGRAETLLEQAKARGDLLAAVVPDQLPMAARDKSGALTGFDVAVAEEIGKRLGLPVKLVTPGWDDILKGEPKGGWDYAVASITPTDARKAHLLFPANYRFDAAVLVTRAGDKRITSVEQASGKRIGVKDDTTFKQYLKKNLPLFEGLAEPDYLIRNATVVSYPTKDAAMTALLKGKVDAVVTALATADAAIKGGAKLAIVPGFLYFEPVAVAVPKADPEFAKDVRAAVDAMRDDGTLSRLSNEWYGIDLTKMLR